MKAALVQLTSTDDPTTNTKMVVDAVARAASQGATFVLTPEVTNCVSTSRKHQQRVLVDEDNDPVLSAVREQAATLGIHLLLGSIAVTCDDPDGRFANRSFLIDPAGDIIGRYDKIHMFDVSIDAQESYRESAGYRPGEETIVVPTPFGQIGMAICYDMRFPALSLALAQAGASILTYPSAFSPVTGQAHWETLLRARAIETGCWVLAPAQTGQHPTSAGRSRETYGHSLAVNPWGEVVLDAGVTPGVFVIDLEPDRVNDARRKVPAYRHARSFAAPT